MQPRGIWTAIVTPFTSGRFDAPAYQKLVERQVEAGVQGIVSLGTTGESPTVSMAEREEIIKLTLSTTAGRIPVIVGCGSNSTAHTLEQLRQAETLGADGALVVTPYYNKPTPTGLLAHFSACLGATSLPIVAYNVPGRTGCNIDPDTAFELSQLERMVAIKEASNNIGQFQETARRTVGCWTVLSGDDPLLLASLACGGQGLISVTSNVIPKEFVSIWKHWENGEIDVAREEMFKALGLIQAMFVSTNPIPVKTALAMMGLIREEFRLPMTSLDEALKPKVAGALKEYGIEIQEG